MIMWPSPSLAGSTPHPPPPPPVPPIMSCFPTVGERDRNGCRAAKTERREGGGRRRKWRWRRWRDGRERREKCEGREVDVKWWVIEGRRKCEAGVWTRQRGEGAERDTRDARRDGEPERRTAGKMLWFVFCRWRRNTTH